MWNHALKSVSDPMSYDNDGVLLLAIFAIMVIAQELSPVPLNQVLTEASISQLQQAGALPGEARQSGAPMVLGGKRYGAPLGRPPVPTVVAACGTLATLSRSGPPMRMRPPTHSGPGCGILGVPSCGGQCCSQREFERYTAQVNTTGSRFELTMRLHDTTVVLFWSGTPRKTVMAALPLLRCQSRTADRNSEEATHSPAQNRETD